MNPSTEKLRKKYMDNPPEGMTSEDIRRMSEYSGAFSITSPAIGNHYSG